MAMRKRVENLTAAELAILESSERLPQSEEKHLAYAALRDNGLPTRRVEAWHYTDLRNAIKTLPPLAESPSQAVESTLKSPLESSHEAESFIASHQTAFIDGKMTLSAALPAGVTAGDMPQRRALRDPSDAVGIINALTGRDGVALSIAAGARPGAIELFHSITSAATVSLGHAVNAGKDSVAVVIERHVGADDTASLSSTLVHLDIADGADVTWLIVQEEGSAATHLSQLNITLGARARLTILCLNTGGNFVRREINIAARGEGSTIAIRGVNLIGGTSHVDVTTALIHEAPGASARELFRNVVTGEGRGVFQGQIRVAQAAQKTDAKMACNTLLLSDTAEFSAKPELEIFADDVACGHGATVTDIRDEHLFYLRARGIPLKAARALLVQAFVEEVFDEIEDEAMKHAFNSRIEAWLVRHG